MTEVTGISVPALFFKVAGRVAVASDAPIAEVVALKLPVGATRTGLTGSAGVVAGVGSLTFPAASVAVTLIGVLGPIEPGRVTAYSPVSFAVPVPTVAPLPSLIVTVEPGSAVPVTV